MPHLNIEIKARTGRPDAIRDQLRALRADFVGTDHQVDTYFHVPRGRLKLREGDIERNLIHYHREDHAGPKASDVSLFPAEDPAELKQVLTRALGVKVVVDKQRKIWFIDNVKFHLDEVAGLGAYVEIEAIDLDGSLGEEKLHAQCRHYMELFAIRDADLEECSYSDLLLRKRPVV